MPVRRAWVRRDVAVAAAIAFASGCGSSEEPSASSSGTGGSGGSTGGVGASGGTVAGGGAAGGGAVAGSAGGGTGASASVFRPFTADSYWNKPLPSNAPIDANNALYIADASDSTKSGPYLGLTGAPGADQAYSAPLYWPKKSDPTYTITPSLYGPSVTLPIPLDALPQSGTDGALWLFDLPDNMLVQLWQATFDAANGWSASSVSRYMIDSNGLDKKAQGSNDALNTGHRGVPPNVQLVRLDEVKAGAIEHRLECYWHATGQPNASTPWFYWPMVGYEQNKGGIVPEGIVIRIQPSIDLSKKGLSPAALVIATALQKYGCTIGDNSGGTNNRLKLERGEQAWKSLDPALTGDALKSLAWSEWEFIQGGYDPP